MFDKSINEICLGISKLKNNNLDEAETHISRMEAYLPIGHYEGLNSICTSYYTVFQQYCDEDYKIKGEEEEFKNKLINIGEKIQKKMEGEHIEYNLRTEICNLNTRTVYTGEIKKIDEDSAIGELIRSHLRE